MHIEIQHSLPQDAAISRVKQALRDAQPHLKGQVTDVVESWEGNVLTFSFVAQKTPIKGTLEVLDKRFVLDATLPLMWRMFEGRIEKMLQEKINESLL